MVPPPKTLATADLLPSDDEDEDFIGGEESDSDSDSEDDRPSKKAKVDAAPVEPTLTKEAVDDLWASFNAPEDPVPSSSTVAPAAPKKITITVQYEFVGETVTQEKEVLADSDEAKAWLAKQKDSGTPVALPPTNSGPPPAAVDVKGKGPISAEDALFGTTDSASTQTPSAAASTSSSSTLPTPVPQPEPPKPAPRRAKGGGLSGLAAALGKPAKLNTLEKSKLDWKKFVDKEDLSDDLTKARKDGYLEKQDFLKRTEDRREDDYDKSKRGRR